MAEITLYHNPNCSKSRGAKEILESRGVDLEIVEYLGAHLSVKHLEQLLELLPDDPAELVRKDSHFKDLGLDAADYTSAAEVAALLASHPKLMQRPVGVRGSTAIIARPSERIEELL